MAEAVVDVVDQLCNQELDLDGRFLSPALQDAAPTPNTPLCGVLGVRRQQQLICRGHYLQTLADTVTPIDFFLVGANDLTNMPASAFTVSMEMREPQEPPQREDGSLPSFTITPPVASNAATLSLAATVAFQHASLVGARAIDVNECPIGTLYGTVPASRDDEGTWSSERVPLAFVLMSGTNESVHEMHGCGEAASRYIRAAADDALSDDRDRGRANVQLFRGRFDSRLEISNMYLGVPTRLFEPLRDGLLVGSADTMMEAAGELAVCDTDSVGAGRSRAEDMVRDQRIRVDLPLDEIQAGAVERNLRDSLRLDLPDIFDRPELGPGAMSDTDFVTQLGLNVADVRDAAVRINAEARVLGRPLVLTETQTIDGHTVERVAGTRRTDVEVSGAYLMAITAGAASISQPENLQERPTADYGIEAIAGDAADDDYALSSIYATTDTVGAALAWAGSRPDIRAFVAGGVEYEASRELGMDLQVFAREMVSYRLDVCVGQSDGQGGVDTVSVELLGSGDDVERYELWWGETGLQCATNGNVEGVPCDERLNRITAEPSVEADGALSGFVPEYLRWEITLADVPALAQQASGGPPPLGLPAHGRIYVTKRATTERSGGRRIAIAGFSVEPGDDASGTYSRCSQMPAGAAVGDRLQAELAASSGDCARPATTCAGMPFDVRLPLEDELTEAMEGSDTIESSFYHYLRLARNAADEADRLGQELIEAGLQGDLRAEAAADALQDLCGPVVNVGSIPGTHADASCTTAGDCPAGHDCVLFRCQPQSVADMVPQEEAGAESLRRCLGDLGDNQVVSLGSTPMCFYRRPDGGPACGCDPTRDGVSSCPPCPFPPQAGTGDCIDPSSPAAGVYQPLLDDGWAFERVDDTLNLVDPQLGGSFVGSCDLFAYLVARADPPADFARETFARDVLTQDWISHAAVSATMNNLTFREDLYENDAILRGGNRWASTGTVGGGSSQVWPCAPLDPPDSEIYQALCVSPPSGVRPLRCGFESCTSPSGNHAAVRAQHNGEMQHLLMILGTLTGGTYALPHTIRDYRPSPAITSQTTALDLAPSIAADASYCLEDYSGDPSCLLARIRNTPNLSYSDSVQQSARCLELFPAVAEGDTMARSTYGICPYHVISHEPLRVFSSLARQQAIDFWHPRGSMDAAITYFYDGTAAPNQQVSFLGGRALQANPDGNWASDVSRAFGDRGGARVNSLDPVGIGFLRPEYVLQVQADWYSPEITHAQLMQALELMCLANASGGGNSCGGASTLPTVRTLDDLAAVATRLSCAADQFDAMAERLILEDVPADVVRQIRDGAIEPTFPAYRGTYGETVAELRAQMENLPLATETIASVLRSFSGEIDIARSQLRVEDLERQIDAWQLAANLATQVANCAEAASGGPIKAGALAAICGAAAVNAASAIATTVIRAQVGDEEIGQVGTGVAIRFGERMDQMREAQHSLSQSYARINGLLAQLDQQRSQANRLAARVMWLDRDETSGREFPVNNVMRARQNTLRIRYERAHQNAIRMTYLARRAVEQRLAVDLSSMRDDMTLVPAPATWADGLCSMRGIDYGEIRGDGDVDVTDYADRFVGDYVRLLELFIESYRLDFPFTDASDVALVSLRDDLLGVRRQCSVSGYNRLAWSSDMSVDSGSEDAGATGWHTLCFEGERCVAAVAGEGSPFRSEPEGVPGAGRITRQRRVGDSAPVSLINACPIASVLPDGTCGAADGGARVQEVLLERGEYLLSWYERLPTSLATSALQAACRDATCEMACTEAGGSPADCEAACVDVDCLQALCAAVPLGDIPFTSSGLGATLTALDESGAPTPATAPTFSMTPTPIDPTGDRWIDACRWRRVFGRFRNPEPQSLRVALGVSVADPSAGVVSVTVAAPQLEALAPAAAALATVLPLPFQGSDSTLTSAAGFCEDTTGERFRTDRYWTQGCEYVCPDGFGGTCTAGDTPDRSLLRCYHETQFDISIDDIDRGELIPTGGFALGNFNYRFDTFGLNVVGTGVRDCSRSETPSACYASGYIPFSVTHIGPYQVRSHLGELIDVPLFTGNVQFAKALAAERYLTNPLSGADRSLLTDYVRTEFRGRPLDGAYRVRIYDADGFDWERVEDVQLILNYRYWTRFE
ncbi:MAG: hypothetical protein H6719_08765 [Sandaracinaceae bacterium]|nr:hypothetical protein [Sandaracinaceae bacterium]